MSTKRNKSTIWQYFNKVGEKMSRCNLCKQECRTAGNTSNLWDHLKRKHKIVYTNNEDSSMHVSEPSIKIVKLETDVNSKPLVRKKLRKTIVPTNQDEVLDKKIIPLPGGRSEIWKRKLFGFYSNDGKTINDKQRAVCNLCRSEIPYSGNTTNLGIHLAKKHPEMAHLIKTELDELGKSTPVAFKSVSPRSSGGAVIVNAISLNPRRAGTLTEAVATFLTNKLISINMDVSGGFDQLLQEFGPRFEAVDMSMVLDLLHSRKEAITNILQDKLAQIESCAIIGDYWFAEDGRTYCTLMVRFIDQDFQVQSYALKTLDVSYNNAIAFSYMYDINAIVSDWNLMPRLVCQQEPSETPTVTEEGSTVHMVLEGGQSKVTGATSNRDQLANAFKVFGNCNIFCFVTLINAALNLGVTEEQLTLELLEKVRRILYFYLRTVKERHIFGRKIDDDEDDDAFFNCDLTIDLLARWTTTYEMIDKFLQSKSIIIAYLDRKTNERQENQTENLTDNEWLQLELLLSLMGGFSACIGIMGGDEPAPCSMILPILQRQKEKAAKMTEDTPAVYNFVKLVWQTLDQTLLDQELQTFISAATFLDPRFKSFEYSAETKEAALEHIRSHMANVEANQPSVVTTYEVVTDSGPPSKRSRRNHDLELLFGSADEKDASTTIFHGNDFERYMQEPSVGFRESPFDWWEKNSHRYPNLSKVAKMYLCVPSSSSPNPIQCGENAKAKELVYLGRRKLLSADDVDLMIFLHKNWSLLG